MAKESFLLNYGGPGGKWITRDSKSIQVCIQECKDYYGPPIRSVELMIRGLKIKVLTYGIHRAIMVELPPGSSSEVSALYDELYEKGFAFCERSYGLLSNNCVTAITELLHHLDPTIPKYLVFPWTLDATLKTYQHHQATISYLKPFFETYEQKSLLSFKSARAKLKEIKSLKDVMVNAYHGENTERERTKSTLLELNWVTEDKNGLLHPTLTAPVDFRLGLLQFNYEYKAVNHLQYLAKEHGMAKPILNNLFKDYPDYDTAFERIKDYDKKHHSNIYNHLSEGMVQWEIDQVTDLDKVTDFDFEDNESDTLSDDEDKGSGILP